MLCNSPIAVTQHFIRAHMEQRNLDEALSCLTDTVEWFGTGAFEIVRGKAEARHCLSEEIASYPGGYNIAFENMSETLLTENSGTVFGSMLVTDNTMGSQLDCRVTATCVRREGGFLIASLHMSLPTDLQNGREYYPLTLAAEKIQQLKDSFFNTTIPGGLICCDAGKGFKLRYVNDFLINLLGYQSYDELLSATGGYYVNCFGDSEDVVGMEHAVEAMEINGHSTFTYRVRAKSGEEIWLREYTHKYEGDRSPELICFCMDISDIIQLERELKEQKLQLEFANAEMQTIISNIPGGVHRCPLFGRIHVNYVSQGFEKMSGYTEAEIHTLFDDVYTKLLVEEDRSVFADAVLQLAVEPAYQILEYRMLRKDGTVIRIEDHLRSVRMEDGRIWGFGVAIDVTAQHETREQLKLLTDSIPGGLAIYEYDSLAKKLSAIYFSDGVCDMVDFSRDEYAAIANDDIKKMVFDEDIPMLREHIERVVEGESSIDCVYRHLNKSGNFRWMNLRGTVSDRRGSFIRVNAVLFDITASKESEEALRIRDEEYALAIKQSEKVVYRFTLSNKTAYMLQKAVTCFDFPYLSENIPDSILENNLIAPESVADFTGFYAAIQRGEKSGTATLRRKMREGGFGWCRCSFTTLFSSRGEPVSAVISIEDITKQHEQELENKALRQNEELFQTVVSHSDRYIVKFDIPSRTAYLQGRTAQTFHVDQVLHDMPYTFAYRGGVAQESLQSYIDFYEKLISGVPTAKVIIKMRKYDQTDMWGWYRFDGSVIFNDEKQPIYAVVSFVEITKQYEKELAYKRLTQHVDRLSKDAMMYFEANLNEMMIKHASGQWLSNVEINTENDLSQILENAILNLTYPDDRSIIRQFFDRDGLVADFSRGITEKSIEYRIIENNQPKWVSVTIEMIADPYTEDILIYTLFQDIDKSKTKEISILKLAETDGLTELYNKTAVEGQVKQILEAGHSDTCALIIVDVDDLKIVNDTLGHIQGDRAIRAFADTLRSFFGEQALLGRVGGDEFLAFLCDVESEAALRLRLDSLVTELSALRVGEMSEYTLHGSLGVVCCGADEHSFEALYKKADSALYSVKRHGKNNFALYSPEQINPN
ncbi:MAG: diguanylate cyclase [Oscillospiraceae bacterium]